MTNEEIDKKSAACEEEQKRLNKVRLHLSAIKNTRKFLDALRSGTDLRAVKTVQITAYNHHGSTIAAICLTEDGLLCVANMIENAVLPQLEAEHESL